MTLAIAVMLGATVWEFERAAQPVLAYMCLEGNFTIEFEGNITEVSKGDTILIPASIDELTLLPEGEVTMLEVYVP